MNYYKKLNIFYELLEDAIYTNNGIIYDEYVCHKILSNHNKELYNNKNLSIENFYDINYDIETKERIIINNKIKIAFTNNNDYIKFIEFFNRNYNLIEELNISIEITISKDEPPYKCNNYTCYGLLLDGKENYYYSKNTGTPYDNIDNVEKKIIKEIIDKQTQYIRGFFSNYDILLDINRMIDNKWKITNLPYNYFKNNRYNDNCPICLSYLNNDDTINIFNYNIHLNCLNSYLLTQKEALVFKCPYRNIIDFNSCKYLTTYSCEI